jgi:hypothetical protein
MQEVVRLSVPEPRWWERLVWWLRDVLLAAGNALPNPSYNGEIPLKNGSVVRWYVEDRRGSTGSLAAYLPDPGVDDA